MFLEDTRYGDGDGECKGVCVQRSAKSYEPGRCGVLSVHVDVESIVNETGWSMR